MMRVCCDQRELHRALQLVGRAVPQRPSHPVLSHMLLLADAGGGCLRLTGFDLEVGIESQVHGEVEQPGMVCLPGRLLMDLVSRLPADGRVTLCGDNGPQVWLEGGGGQRCLLIGEDAEEYPDLPRLSSGATQWVAAADVVQGLQGTLYAVGKPQPDLSPHLGGVRLSIWGEGCEYVATDGLRLAVVRRGADLDDQGKGIRATVPGRALRELLRLLAGCSAMDQVRVSYWDGLMVWVVGTDVVSCRTLQGEYPAWDKAMPKRFAQSVKLEREALIAALAFEAAYAVSHSNNVVAVTLLPDAGRVLLRAETDQGWGEHPLAAEVVTGQSVTVALNVRYVLDALRSMACREVWLQLNGQMGAAVIEPVSEGEASQRQQALVMPVQIGGAT
ncbi:MAG: DNA polymerase III subunit beta [Aphanocapsa feldmannii 277cI]|uniref:Beta sliding clamp n=1 Tax=Aphanocapsa feldmannii 277cI TaxID=2507554 RepID=A0A524RUQ4_9CHRO|nr:MAG: DNA polymerase III subunit beta [Aphanocapsa feldmannii 277cI]